jgi:hypothetical protein
MRLLKKRFYFTRYSVLAVLIILFAIVLRLALIALGWPPLDSDVGTVGIMGMHIAFKGQFPVFFYGQGYMGTFEAYVAAFFFRLFGVSFFSLALGLVLMYGVFLGSIYYLSSLLYSRGLALLTVLLLSLGSNPMFSRELVALGGYPDTLFFGALMMLLASWLALTSGQDAASRSQSERRRRLAAYAGWGLVAGLGLWTHVLTLPFTLCSAVLLWLFCRAELRGKTLFWLVAMLVLGMLPLLAYNAIMFFVNYNATTLFYLIRVHGSAGVPIPPGPPLFLRQLWGSFLIALPTMTGATPVCNATQVSTQTGCLLWHASWAFGLVGLWLWALGGTLRVLWNKRRLWWGKSRVAPVLEERTELVLYTARLALLGTSGLSFLLYVISSSSGLFPVATSRYLVGLLVSTPALLWPLWKGARSLFQRSQSASSSFGGHPVVKVGQTGGLLFVGVIYLLGTLSIFTGFPASPPLEQRWGAFTLQINDQHLALDPVREYNRQQEALVRDLLRTGNVHIYSDYWTCNRLIFVSQERIICAVVDINQRTKQLKIGQNRYTPYLRQVQADPHAAYVLPEGSPEEAACAQMLRTMKSPDAYQRFEFDGYVIYQPRR